MNGRMTFRFDIDQDKSKLEPVERRSSAGLGTARDYENKELHSTPVPLHHTQPYDTGFTVGGEEPPDDIGDDDLEPYNSHGQEWEGARWEAEPPKQPLLSPYPDPDVWERAPQYPVEEWNDSAGRFGDISLSSAGYGGSYHTRRPSYWWKFALSIAGAVGTGLLLGYAALSFISGGSPQVGENTKPGAAAVQNQNGGTANQPVAGDTGLPNAGPAGSEAARIQVAVAAQSYYLLQYGVFSTPDGAAQAQQELLTAGLAAGLDPSDGNRVYAGISPDREQAKLLSSGLKNQGIELYVRGVELPAAEQVAFAGTAQAVEGYFAASGQLLNELSSLSASLLSGEVQTLDKSAVSNLHMEWTEALKALKPGLTPEGQSICAGLEKAMSRGMAALNEYEKNKAPGLLWEVQEAMLSFLTGQKGLMSTLV